MRLGYETPPDHPTPELRELWYDECLMTEEELKVRSFMEKLEALHRRIEPLAIEIRETQTLAGLRTKAIDAVQGTQQLWKSPHDDLDWDEQALRSLIEAVCVLSRLDVPKENLAQEEEAA